MAKKNWIGMLIALTTILGGIAVGGLFLNGTTLANPILGWIPQIIHKIVAWVIIVSGLLEGLRLFGLKI